MVRSTDHQIGGHDVVEHRSANRYQPYDRLVLRDPNGRTVWTVLSCEKAEKSWDITAIRCPRTCRTHIKKR